MDEARGPSVPPGPATEPGQAPAPALPPLPKPRAAAADSSTFLGMVARFVGTGFYDPFSRFAFRVDHRAFLKGQAFLVGLSLAAPILALLFGGLLLAMLHYAVSTLHPPSAQAPFHRVALFPLAFVVIKGYWVAYLLLPLGLLGLAWAWSALTAWWLVRFRANTLLDFKRGFPALAALAAMLGPFTLFPFLRLLALGAILWFTGKRLRETFAVPVRRFLGAGGCVLAAAALGWGGLERWVEGRFPDEPSLTAQIEGLRDRGTLDWPTRVPKKPLLIEEKLLADLKTQSGDALKGTMARAWAQVASSTENPELRFAVVLKLAELGHPEAAVATVRNYRKGTGVPVNLGEAEVWVRRILGASPKNVQARMEEALLLVLRGDRLAGKRRLVALAKEQPDQIGPVAEFIAASGLGKANLELTRMLQNSYWNCSAGRWDSPYGRNRPWEDGANISKRIADLESEGVSCWFYSALLTEYRIMGEADASTYGEAVLPSTVSELEKRAAEGDLTALEILADRCVQEGRLPQARSYWLRAVTTLFSDSRGSNGPFYQKLAESYDPKSNPKDADPQLAAKYYLASLLLSAGRGQTSPVLAEALGRLGLRNLGDPRSQEFLALCTKHDIPEAWVMMGDRFLSGGFPETPQNPQRARDCLLKAEGLGYRSPWLYANLARLDSGQAEHWKQLAQGRSRS